MKIRFELKTQNARLIEERKRNNLTQEELAELAGCPISFLSDIENLKSPKGIRETLGRLKSIASVLECDFNYLFPQDYMVALAEDLLPRSDHPLVAIKEIAMDMAIGLQSQYFLSDKSVEEEADLDSLKEIIEQTLDQLPAREARVLAMRYGLRGEEQMSFEEVARKIGVSSRERVRQIEMQALERLRHPTFRRKMRPYLER